MFERRRAYLLLSALSVLLFGLNLGGATLWDLDEGRNATAALEMLDSGNWIVPTFNAHLRDHKPALLYWLQALAYTLFGISEFSARLPSALAAWATVLVVYELARAMFGKNTGLLAGIIVATTPMLCGASRFANPDALLNGFIALTLTCFWFNQQNDTKRFWFLALGAASGGAVLAKGPVGFVLPAAIIGLYFLWLRQLQRLLDRRWLEAFFMMLLVALPWYILVAVQTRSSFIEGFILQHNVKRFLEPMESHQGSSLYYPLVLLVGLAPWSIFLGPTCWYAGWSTLRNPAVHRQAESKPEAYRLLSCWVVMYLVFFTLAATKLPNYVLPVVVPCAILLARFLERWRCQEIQLPAWVGWCSLTCLIMIGIGLGSGLAIAGGAWLPGLMRARDIMPGLAVWSWIGLIPILAGIVGFLFLRQGRRTGLVVSVSVGAILLLAPLAAFASVFFNQQKAPQALVDEIGACQPGEDIRVGCFNMEHLPSLNFYVQRDVIHLKNDAEVLHFLRYPLPVYLFVPASDWDRLATQALVNRRVIARHREMYHGEEVVVVRNR